MEISSSVQGRKRMTSPLFQSTKGDSSCRESVPERPITRYCNAQPAPWIQLLCRVPRPFRSPATAPYRSPAKRTQSAIPMENLKARMFLSHMRAERASPHLPFIRQALHAPSWVHFVRLLYLTALTFSHFRLCPEASTASQTYCVCNASLKVGLAGLPVATPSRKSAS